ncbi:hypothetical protein M1P56_23945 [Streptomyces sp. HU2014]|uniref:hypothetical protein n=1 Tax=Streptomyces sp. HU2014 TaxID=2939414 RepID=UPI00201063D0|nr:hypothetical protein [Streptomyces sp. HU2014]UQI47178.1 hypothetical protein M1P56_23945 [Streptomyces sp. HU2014]
MKSALTEQQVCLLREVAASSGATPIPSKSSNTAWALEQRGLIKRSWTRNGAHVAIVTADGRYYLKHGRHPQEVQAEKDRLKGDSGQAALAPDGGADLITRMRSAAGKIIVSDPGPKTRGRWRAAYYAALHQGHVPEGHKLRWSGRQRGDCVFTLVDEEAERAAQPPPVPTIEVPDTLDDPHRLVRATHKALGRSQTVVDTRGKADVIPLHTSRTLVDRALRIMHALLNEAENRGYKVETRTELHRGEAAHDLVVVIRGQGFPLVITEQTTKVPHEPTSQEIRQLQRNPWKRLPKHDEEFNGRLSVGAPVRNRWQSSNAYDDGARWPLESRLGHLLRDLEDRALEAERQQRETELREAEQRRQWYAVIAQARRQQMEQHRAKALLEQAQAWRQATELRALCQAAQARADDSVPAAEQEWLDWAEGYAAILDPLSSPLLAPPDPPASREALREFLRGDLHAHPWPFDSQGRWMPDTDEPSV